MKLKKPINENQVVKDWDAGLTWREICLKQQCRSDVIREIVTRLKLPRRNCGPVAAKNLDNKRAQLNAKLQRIIKDYVKGVKLPVIMKKYHVGHESIRYALSSYKGMRRTKLMQERKKERNAKSKRTASELRKKCREAHTIHLLDRS
jgi:hypothetical protein